LLKNQLNTIKGGFLSLMQANIMAYVMSVFLHIEFMHHLSCIKCAKWDLLKVGAALIDVVMGKAILLKELDAFQREQLILLLKQDGMDLLRKNASAEAILVNEGTSIMHEALNYLELNDARGFAEKHKLKMPVAENDYKLNLEELLHSVLKRKNRNITKAFDKIKNKPPRIYFLALKIDYAEEMAKDHFSIEEIAYRLQFCDESHLRKTYKKFRGKSLPDFIAGLPSKPLD